MVTEKNNRYSYIRALACVGIVFLHMFYGAVSIYGTEASKISADISWIVVNNLYWAVPCFVMVTGALLLNPSRELTYKKLFSKYIFRVVVALFIFSILYRIFDIVMNGEPFTAGGFFKGFSNFLTGNGWSHLWYLYMLVGLYLLMPFFKKITEHVHIKELCYLLILMVVFLSLIPILKLWNIGTGFGIPIATIYPFYLFFGYTVSLPEVKMSKWVAIVCLVASTAAITVLTLLRWSHPETMMNLEIFFNYSSILVILQATSIFYLFMKKNKEMEKTATETPAAEERKEDEIIPEKKENIIRKFVLSFDSCSFGVYFVHMFLARLVLRYMGLNPYENIPLFIGLIIAILIVSYFIVWLIRKIPKVNKVL